MINYSDLCLSVDKTRSTFSFKGVDIEIANYLPTADKYDLIMTTIQKAREKNYYNTFKLSVFFTLNLIYMYTNIVFTIEDREDEGKLFDELKSSGFVDAFLQAFPKEEYNFLFTFVQNMAKIITESDRSAGSIISNMVKDLPANAETAMKIFKDINPDTFKTLLDTVKQNSLN